MIMKKCGVLKKGVCIFLAFVITLSIIIIEKKAPSKASDFSNESINNQQEIQVKQANGTYEYDQPDNIINDKYRNFYQIMVAHFCDSNGDGKGDLNGVTSKLDYIKDLGYNGIWLTPIFYSKSSHKYDIWNYTMISPDFGTLDDFKTLVSECKKRDISLILDMVINHSCQNIFTDYNNNQMQDINEFWLYNALKDLSPENKYYNYFNFSSTKKDDTYIPVNKYINGYNNALKNAPEYQLNPCENELYLECTFSPSMPDLNLTSPDLRKEFESIIKYWLDLGVDGFRLDAAKHYIDETKHDDNIEVLTWFNNYVKSINPNAYIVGEVWDSPSVYQKYYKSGIDSLFGFSVADSTGLIVNTINGTTKNGPKELIRTLINENKFNKRYNENAISAIFLSNHDMERTNEYLNNDIEKIKLARGLYQMLSGTTFTYYGEEIGMAGNKEIYGYDASYRLGMYWSEKDLSKQPVSQDFYNNKDTKYCVNANEDEQHKCNLDCIAKSKNYDNEHHKFGSVEQQQNDPNSILNYMKRILQLKNENPEIARGEMELIDFYDNDILGIRKTYNDSSVIILINLSNENKSFNFSKKEYAYSDIRGYATTDDTIVKLKKNKITMASNAIVVLK